MVPLNLHGKKTHKTKHNLLGINFVITVVRIFPDPNPRSQASQYSVPILWMDGCPPRPLPAHKDGTGIPKEAKSTSTH